MLSRSLLLVVLVAALAATSLAEDLTPAVPRDRHLDLITDRPAHDFGAVPQDAVRNTVFTYTNQSDHAVRGIRARGQCGCNVVALSHKELAPGASGTLNVEFNTLTLAGHLTKRVYLASSDHTRGELVIPLKIAIVEGLIVRPGSVSYGDVALGSRPSRDFNLRWYEGSGEPFEITAVEVPGFEFDSRITPYVNTKDPLWRGWTVTMTFKELPPVGIFSAEVLVRTTSKKRPRITLPLSANVSGKIWMQSRTLSFGSFRHGEKMRTASLKFSPSDKDGRLTDVRAVTRLGSILVEVKPDPLHADKGVWRLYGRVPLDTPPGRLDQEVIELHTGMPGEEVILVKVRGYVRSPRRARDGR